MKPAQQYRALAADLRRRADRETEADSRAEWETLAKLYDRLASQAEQNDRTGELYDPILNFRPKPGNLAG